MEKNRLQAGLAWVALIAPLIVFRGAMAQNPPASPPAVAALACRAVEIKTDEQMGVALVVFHQANKSDAARLGELLRANDGASVKFETSDGRSHKATLFRLGTCFGRGLLVFRTGDARLTPKEQFWLRFPKPTNPPARP